MVELIRFSGYRLRGLPPDQAIYRWTAMRNQVEKYVPYLQNLPLGFYADDVYKNLPIIDTLMGKLQNGEIYFAFTGQRFVGLAAITDIEYGRNAYIEAIAAPEFIKSFAVGKATGELITYAFADFGDAGLGLKKLKAGVMKANMGVLTWLQKIGFNPAGILQGEVLHMGIPHDMILLELLNPKFFSVDKRIISNDRQRTVTSPIPPATSLQPASASGASAESQFGDTSGDDAATDRAGGSAIRDNITSMVAADELQWNSEPVGTRGSGRTVRSAADTTGGELVHAESGAAAGVRRSVGNAKQRAKLR